MEQTNLVVTPDGKTWDEVTRDVSYIGNLKCKVLAESNMTTANAILPMHYFRGSSAQNGTLYGDRFTKDFAIGYDCLICLVAGQYKIIYQTYSDTDISANTNLEIQKNGQLIAVTFLDDASKRQPYISAISNLKKGDYIQWKGIARSYASAFDIIRVG